MRYKQYVICQGDTMQSIAQHIIGDQSQWVDLVKFNQLKYPYLVPSNEDKEGRTTVLTIGDVLTIPIVDGTVIETVKVGYNERNLVTNYAMGADLNITSDLTDMWTRGGSDEVFALNEKGNILDTVAGYDNLTQAIYTRLATRKGTLPLHPEFGNDLVTYLGKTNTVAVGYLIRTEVERVLLGDPRIQKVEVAKTMIETDNFSCTINVTPINAEEQVSLVLNMNSTGSIQLK
ncbi:hypothetical protein [Brochothrix phage ADU4]|uniref:Gp104 n=1 Tax=Brochothrix phage A9 TaxID=857312 RepID=D9J0Q1_9CAUD|nr:baseplate protein [Brochothrix phage A9]ADJ53138.1 gp104 [Brochothrix phage A9]UKM96594.1 hypothetical protein [Brochothrix phage ADU4]